MEKKKVLFPYKYFEKKKKELFTLLLITQKKNLHPFYDIIVNLEDILQKKRNKAFFKFRETGIYYHRNRLKMYKTQKGNIAIILDLPNLAKHSLPLIIIFDKNGKFIRHKILYCSYLDCEDITEYLLRDSFKPKLFDNLKYFIPYHIKHHWPVKRKPT